VGDKAMLVAIVEDDEDIATVITTIIRNAGHETSQYPNAAAFLADIRSHSFDLILCDIGMPQMDGIELRQHMVTQGLQRNAGFIFITARQSPEYRTRAWDVQADGYLQKPFSNSELLALVNNVARRRANWLTELFHDPLTNLYNRRYLEGELHKHLHGAAFHLILIDIDFFKTFNDKYGHLEGDRCLRRIADLMRSTFADDDPVIRMGGEEFLIVCAKSEKEVREACEKLQAILDAERLPHEGSPLGRVTISGGILLNCQNAESGMETYYKAVDDLLYRAKEVGRNRFETGMA
jgi:diguanylate cyclase (GGDEF)-like protein